MRLAIDFDGVIHDWKHPPPGRRMGPPMPGAVEALTGLFTAGHTIIVHTVRENGHVTDWLRYFQVPFAEVTSIKPNADLYLDDRALRHVDWPSTLEAIEREVHGEEDHGSPGRRVRQDGGEEEAVVEVVDG